MNNTNVTYNKFYIFNFTDHNDKNIKNKMRQYKSYKKNFLYRSWEHC